MTKHEPGSSSPWQRIAAGSSWLARPTWPQFLGLHLSCLACMLVGLGIGYLATPDVPFADSVGAGLGFVVGLAVWIVGVGRLVWLGGQKYWRELLRLRE